jgi:hypothetical protein
MTWQALWAQHEQARRHGPVVLPDDPATLTLGELIVCGPKDPDYRGPVLTDYVMSGILQVFRDTPAAKLAANETWPIANTLDKVFTAPGGYPALRRERIATSLIAYIRKLLQDTAVAVANSNAMRELLAMAQDEFVVGASIADSGPAVCRRVRIQANVGDVSRVICLGGGRVVANIGAVHLLLSPGVEVEQVASIGKVTTQHRSPVELLKIAKSYPL